MKIFNWRWWRGVFERKLARFGHLEKIVRAHESSPRYGNAGPIFWRLDGTCSYCGSISVKRAIELLLTPGTHFSGTDWKYGWPHKFYIHPSASLWKVLHRTPDGCQ